MGVSRIANANEAAGLGYVDRFEVIHAAKRSRTRQSSVAVVDGEQHLPAGRKPPQLRSTSIAPATDSCPMLKTV